jgi:hypothetical protein
MGMRALDVLKHVDFEKMTKAEKAELKKRFTEHRTHLKNSLKAVETGLTALSKKPKGKK